MSRCYEQLLKKVSGKVLPDHLLIQRQDHTEMN